MSNEFPKISEVFTLDKAVTYKEAVEQVWLPQDNAMLSVPSVSPIETIELVGNTITPKTALVQITYNIYLTDKIVHFIDYSNLRDGAILHIRIQDDTFPITIKNGVVGNGSILTADGSDITLDDYRKVVQFQREGSIWRQVGGVQTQADDKTIARTEDNTFEVFGIKDQGVDATAKKIWTGTREAFELLEEKADDVFYFVQDQGIYLGEKEVSGSGGISITYWE